MNSNAVEQVLVPMRLTPDEKANLYARAKAAGVSANEYVRRFARGEEAAPALPPSTPEVAASQATVLVNTGTLATWDTQVVLTAPIPPRRVQTNFHWPWEARLNTAVHAGYHVLVIAPHGIGKSVWASNLATDAGRPFYMATCSAGISRETLEGQFLPKPGTGTVELQPVDGLLSSAVAQPAIFLCEEFTMMPADTAGRLLTSLNTHGGVFDVPYRGGHVPVHPQFQMIATANPPRGEYLGTERLNAALLSRWWVEELPAPTETDLLNFSTAVGLKYPTNKPICALAVASYAKFEAGEAGWDNVVSPREIALFAKGIRAQIPERDVFFGTIANKFAQGRSAKEQQEVRHAIWDMYSSLLQKGTP